MKPGILNMIIGGLLVLSGLFIYLYITKTGPSTFNEKPVRDSILALSVANKLLNEQILVLKKENDTLHTIKEKIYIQYRDQAVALKDKDIDQLDSIIKSNY